MKAMILVAGRGVRLRPITDRVPKCMVPIDGKPLVQHTIEWCRHFGFEEFVLNPCHLAEAIISHFGDGRRFGVRIHYSVEDQPLGTAGGVKRAASIFGGTFLVWYGDNLSRCDLHRLCAQHRAAGALATIALHYRGDPTQSGVVGLDSKNRITRFLEKPEPHEVFSHWVSAGIMVMEPAVLDAIPDRGCADFGRHVFPRLLSEEKPLCGYKLSEQEGLWWIDRPEDLARVQAEVSGLESEGMFAAPLLES